MTRIAAPHVLARVLLPLTLGCLEASPVAAGKPAHEPTPEALVAEVPFHPDTPASRVTLDLAPDGRPPFVLLLDTGASASVFSVGAARALGVSIRRDRSTAYRKATRLGRDLQFWVSDSSSDTASRTGWDYALLGADFLDDYVLEIDYPGRTVRFYDPRRFAVPESVSRPDESVLRFRRNGRRILTDLEIEGTVVTVLLDTGSPGVAISGRVAEKAAIAWKDLPELEGVQGTLGDIHSLLYTAQRLRFGGFLFSDQPMTIMPRGAYNQGGPTESVLGYDVLKDFVMRIDYPRRRIWLRRGPKRATTFFGQRVDSSGPFAGAARAPSEDEIAEKDAEIAAKWEATRDSRRYAETSDGRFVVVEGYRLRRGPQEGEVWYSHDEMLALQKQRAQEAGEAP